MLRKKGNPRNEKDVQEVIITYPSSYLKDGVKLIDTPGVGSVYEHNTDVAYQYLPKSDAALLGIEIVASSLTLLLPKFIGEKIILKKVKEYLHRVIDLQSARAGHDFEERLDKSKLDFRWEMFQRIEATIEGISKAIEKGMSQKSKGEEAVEEHKAVLIEAEKRMDEIKDKLIRVQQQVSS